MIKVENVTINNREFKRAFSDTGHMIRKVGTQEVYVEAVDVLTATWQFEETDELIEKESEAPSNG